MKTIPSKPAGRLVNRFFGSVAVALQAIALCLFLFTGIRGAAIEFSDLVIGPGFKPSNVYRLNETLPSDVRRVLVLPLAVGDDSFEADSVKETMTEVVKSELLKTRQLEFVFVSPDVIQTRTGRRAWRSTDKLPPEFLAKLKVAHDTEAVLFCELARFRSSHPLTAGWKFSLVKCEDGAILWAADEIFDSSERLVANAARRHFRARRSSGDLESKMVLKSPLYFGQYSVAALLETMPVRKIITASAKGFRDSAERESKSSRDGTKNSLPER